MTMMNYLNLTMKFIQNFPCLMKYH